MVGPVDPPPLTLTTTDARLVTSYVSLVVMVCDPETSSDAATLTAVPFIVDPVMNPVVLVTLGVTDIEWFDTDPFVAVGVPAVPLGMEADA